LSAKQLQQLQQSSPIHIIDTRWVLIRKQSGQLKARLVVKGCQESPLSIRKDAPTCSSIGLMLLLGFSSQSNWSLVVLDAQCAYLQSEGIDRLLILRLPQFNPPVGTVANQLVIANGSIYGTRDAPRAWYKHLKTVLVKEGFKESFLEKGLYIFHGSDGCRCLIATHVDDLLVTFKKDDVDMVARIDRLKKLLRLRTVDSVDGSVVYCGRNIETTAVNRKITQPKAVKALDTFDVDPARKSCKELLLPYELTGYRSMLGQLLWLALHSRPDIGYKTNKTAQLTEHAVVPDLISLNKLVLATQSTGDRGIVIPHCAVDMKTCSVLAYGDSAFANAEGCKSQYGVIIVLTNDVEAYINGRFSCGYLLQWTSATVKRVVRSTLAAEAYAISEALELGQLIVQLLAEINFKSVDGQLPVIKQIENSENRCPLVVCTDSNNLFTVMPKDTTTVADKRLRIVIAALRQSFSDNKTQLKWISTKKMLADPLTKVVKEDLLVSAMAGVDAVS